MAERWRLPSMMIDSIRHHHDPDAATSSIELARAVRLGALAAATLSLPPADAKLAEFCQLAEQWCELADPASHAVLTEVATQAHDLSSLFQIDTGSPADVNAILAQAEEASLRHQLIMQRETQELRQVNSTLTRMTITDALTGVGNRKQFDMELPRMFSQAQSAGQCLAVIMIDADRFKNINDAHGHQAGDVVLIEMANRIRAQVAASGLVCRYGGEEFAVLLPNSDRRDGARMAECIRLAVGSTPIDIGAANSPAASLTATISLGVAAYEPCVAHRLSSHQLLTHAADRALYVAKNAGRNSVRVFSAQSQPVAA
jgi:diguanylate cyclase (GGDEF)-like protein